MTSTYEEDEYRQGDNCVACIDGNKFTTTYQTTLYPIHHEEAVQLANQEALRRAAQDKATGCSLSKEDLFLFHFAKAYPTYLSALREKAGDACWDEILRRMEENKEYRDKCCDRCRETWYITFHPPSSWAVGSGTF